MTTRKSQRFDANKAYENQIAPQLQKLLNKCKHYGFPALVAISVPLTAEAGITMTYMAPDNAGRVPTDFFHAYQMIERPPQDTVTEVPEAAQAQEAAATADTTAG